ncbi:MAG: tripartite tricarboxylate transporter substrate binding protein [Alphaproteobacteria bacterium]|nr:tripartite tricarboxylate transporter substrate binding protein [Alphaproteobacteria bacterium]
MYRYIALSLCAAALLFGAEAQAQSAYPSRPVRFIVPFPPGPAEVLVRLYAQKLQEQTGQPFLVETRPGATGTVGTQAVARAAPDGYTLLATVDLPVVKAPALIKLAYDPAADLVPLAIVAEDFNVLAVHPSVGARTAPALAAAARARPGALNFSSAGNGSPGHMCGEMIKGAAGIQMTHVPYNGAGPSVTALVAGEVQVFCGPPGALLPHINAGSIFATAVTGDRPSALLPGIPPLAETWPGVSITNWYGFLAPAGTPSAIVETLRRELRRAYEDPAVQQRLGTMGIEPRWLDGTASAARIRADLAKWSKVVKDANIKAD